MTKYSSLIFFVLLITFSNSVLGQYVSHATKKDRIKIDTLVDKKSGTKFFIDKERIYITAIDKNGKILWRTDPVIDNKIEKYRIDRPKIVYFAFGNDDRTRSQREVIWLSYSNTQFGYLDKTNGKFTFQGQD